VISFAGGLPAPEFFPVDELKEAARLTLEKRAKYALQYGETEGIEALRQFLAERMKSVGVKIPHERVLITSASQQGLDLIGKLFIDDGTYVVTSRPTYLGAIQAFNAYAPKYVTLNSDDDGVNIDELEKIIEKYDPRFIYLVPSFQNPDGRTLSFERRKRIAEISVKYNLPVVEDDPYSELVYEGEKLPPIIALAPDNVIMLGTFSKIISPGLRIGWIIAPEFALDKLVKLKQGADLHTSTFAQWMIYEFLAAGNLDKHIQKLKSVYRNRLKAMLESIERYFPYEVKTSHPKGGLFLWAELPNSLDTSELLPYAVEKGVAYIPGTYFFPDGGGKNTMRLNFSYCDEATIEEGIKRLGDVFKQAIVRLKV
ncbi:MAG: PLP-dependent aminotransferase family protein, partial [bacterium]